MINWSTENASVIAITNNSITVTWEQISDVTPTFEKFYGYTIQYRVHDVQKNYIEAANITYSSQNNYFSLMNLTFNTVYDIQILPFKSDGGLRKFGTPYPVISAKTRCIRKFINIV